MLGGDQAAMAHAVESGGGQARTTCAWDGRAEGRWRTTHVAATVVGEATMVAMGNVISGRSAGGDRRQGRAAHPLARSSMQATHA